MENLRTLLKAKVESLEQMEKILTRRIQNAPQGYLKISGTDKATQYYHLFREGDNKKQAYIPSSDRELAKQLAQKRYDEAVLKIVNRRIRQMKKLSEEYSETEIEDIFSGLHELRKELIEPIEPTWDMRVTQWLSDSYDGKEFRDGTPVIYTEKGLRVRSKSEKLIADYLDHNNIPFKYEKPLHLKGFGYVYPDFTILSRRRNEEIYWEHEGMMDDPGYARNAVKKIVSYAENGIIAGDRLILTFETQETVINTKDVALLVKQYL